MWPKKSEQWRSAWGYDFEWTPEHLTEEQVRPLIFSYDTLASECLERLDQLSPQPIRTQPKRASGTAGDAEGEDGKHPNLYELLERHKGDDESLQTLWQEVNTVPEWVDWHQIERGQRVFYRYAGPTIIALTFQSLLGGMGGRRVVETLSRTGGFGIKVARRRLLETFQHLLEVTRDIDSIKPGGGGFASSIKVRFLHASVRRRIIQLAQQKPEYYDVNQYGVPINDLDSIATIISFSATLIWIGFPRQGIYLREQEAADYIALWRWVAHLLGTPTDPFSTPARAKAMMESLLTTEIHPTETSRILANNIIASLQDRPPTYASAAFLQAEAHWLNGHALADALAVPRPPHHHTALVAGQCLFFMATCYLRRCVPAWDDAAIARFRLRLRRVVADMADGGAVGDAAHEFRYVPAFGLTTTRGGGEAEDGEEGAGAGRGKGVEMRNLGALLVGAGVGGMLAWIGVRSALSMLWRF
ncbi:tat pathway signal sequence [Phialemonium atrogriseum]|uniref:Tat pathway signal sequence n=1 Tax=Phialemonium atrogriseum TaxID=1093897 RepID=A0AAJ0CBI9_9PEZI|nr:tat pathway signal sequence [Phialemonium atrogriseum]KAK1772458.1 tat pathway signal sequence [Phialemonium atrogriseum]